MPYRTYRPDQQIYSATYPITRMNLISARKLAKMVTDIEFMIEDGKPYEFIDDAIEEMLDDNDFFPWNHRSALKFYRDLLPRLTENYMPSNQERIGHYVDYLMQEKGFAIDYIAKVLPLLRGHWSDARIDSVASVAYEMVTDMLTQYEEGSYPPALREKYANSGKYERDWVCVAILYRPVLDDLLALMKD